MKLNFLKKVAAALTASMLTLSMVAPAMATTAAQTAQTNVLIHKIKMNDLQNWPKAQAPDGTYPGEAGGNYDGSRIQNIEQYFGTGSSELAGVYFKYYTLTKEQYETASRVAPDSEADLLQALTLDSATALNPREIGPTTADGNGLSVVLDYPVPGEAYYWFIELPRGLANGDTLSQAKAVPFGLVLPIYNKDGVVFDNATNPLHVYPKNTTTDKPEITKAIKTQKNPSNIHDAYPYNIGDDIPYKITTTVKKMSNYETLRWSDRMTEGLTMGTSVTVKVNNAAHADKTLTGADYTFTRDDDGRGFTLFFTETGLNKVNLQPDNTTITIEYTAELNEKALVAIPESNDVTFNYGNNPSEGNTPKPTKPGEDKSITVKKEWDRSVTAEEQANIPRIKVRLYNAQTGELVGGQAQDLTEGNGWSYTWTNLEEDIEYYAVEEVDDGSGLTPTYDVEVTGTGDTELKITNKKTGNPPPISPEEPRVVTFGRRFIKVDKGTSAALSGAKFVVGKEVNGANKYMALKTATEQREALTAYNDRETAYQNALNELNATKTSDPNYTTKQQAVTDAKAERDKKYAALTLKWKWVDTEGDAFTFTTGGDGKFAVAGLEKGNYFLKETQAPVGYVKLTNNITFEVNESSWDDNTADITIDKHTKVPNSKVTIPQTGGIGTILFTLAGATLMGGAVFAMKKRDEDEE